MKEFIQPGVVAIYCTPEDLYEIKKMLKETFNNRFLYTKIFPNDIINKDDQAMIIEQTHNRAHRNHRENIKQIYSSYYLLATNEKTVKRICQKLRDM